MKAMCQSCGMPLDKDTARNENSNPKYCSYCWADGKFTSDTTDVKEFQEICRRAMIEHGMPKWKAWLFSRGYSRLERWKK